MNENTTNDRLETGSRPQTDNRNIDMFFAVADVLDFIPETYDQTEWGQMTSPSEDEEGSFYENELGLIEHKGCKTTACVAGWVAILAGWHPTINYVGGVDRERGTSSLERIIINYGEVCQTPLTDGTGRRIRAFDMTDPGEIWDVADLAQEILGISDEEASALFESSPEGSATGEWTGDELRRIGKGANIFAIQEEEGQQEDSDG